MRATSFAEIEDKAVQRNGLKATSYKPVEQEKDTQ